jgi:hypothetical protein
MITAALAIVIISAPGSAQRLEVTPFVGYQFFGSLGVVEGDLNILDSENYGFTIDYTLNREYQLEVLYIRQQTRVELEEQPLGTTRELFDIDVEYFQLGAVYRYHFGNIHPFVSGGLGMTEFDPKEPNVSNEYWFSASFGGGVKVLAAKRLGIRLQGRLLLPIEFSGGALFCGGGQGCTVILTGGTAIAQVDLSAGLVLHY